MTSSGTIVSKPGLWLSVWLLLPPSSYMSSPCRLSVELQTLWCLIFTLFSLTLSPLSLFLFFLPHLCVSSPQPLSILSLFLRNTLYPCLFTDLSPLSPYLSSQRSLQSRQCTFSVTVPLPPLLPPLSLSVHWTWINSSQCSPWQRGPQSVTPPAWGTTVLLWHCHIGACHTQTCTNSQGSPKEHCVCACFCVSVPFCFAPCLHPDALLRVICLSVPTVSLHSDYLHVYVPSTAWKRRAAQCLQLSMQVALVAAVAYVSTAV